MTDRTSYRVTPLAGPKVAGRRVDHGATIELTEAEARAELIAGVIEPVGPAEAPPEPAVATDTADTGRKKR